MNTQESEGMKDNISTLKTTKINFLCNIDLLSYVIFLQHFTNLDTEWSHICINDLFFKKMETTGTNPA